MSLRDLYPTLTALAGIDAPTELAGHDLSPALVNGHEPDRDPVVVDNFLPYSKDVNYRLVREGAYKYVLFRDAPDLFFDLSEDPLEMQNSIQSTDAEYQARRDRLRSYAEESLNFDDVDDRYAYDQERYEERKLAIPTGKGNTYHMPDGRIIDADSFLYYPHVHCERPEQVFTDFFGEDNQHQ